MRTTKQQEHVEGTPGYRNRVNNTPKSSDPPSYFFADVDIEKLCRKEMGLHEPRTNRSNIEIREYFSADSAVGMFVYRNPYDGRVIQIETNRVCIVYSRDGWHAIPVKVR